MVVVVVAAVTARTMDEVGRSKKKPVRSGGEVGVEWERWTGGGLRAARAAPARSRRRIEQPSFAQWKWYGWQLPLIKPQQLTPHRRHATARIQRQSSIAATRKTGCKSPVIVQCPA
jgi:hypothetical protein